MDSTERGYDLQPAAVTKSAATPPSLAEVSLYTRPTDPGLVPIQTRINPVLHTCMLFFEDYLGQTVPEGPLSVPKALHSLLNGSRTDP